MAKNLGNLSTIFRDVVGRRDVEELPEPTVLGYLNDFISIDSNQKLKLFDQKSFYEFNLVQSDSKIAVDLEKLGFTTFMNPIWIGGFKVKLFYSPEIFFGHWPETTTYAEQRPTEVLFYNNELVFRGPSDSTYSVKITAYKQNASLTEADGTEIRDDYLYRYYAYGAAVDFLRDKNDPRLQTVLPNFLEYRADVQARSLDQYLDMRANPQF